MTVTVVIPTFNEDTNVGRLIHETFRVVPREMLNAVKIGMRRIPWQTAPSMNAGGKNAEISVEFAGMGCALSPNSLCHFCDAGWSSPVARQAHNLKAAGSNPAPATIST
jgi:hypothetical protein